MLVTTRLRMDIPQETREVFSLLHDAGLIDAQLRDRMQRMVGFRNLAVHEYQRIQRAILDSIIRDRLDDFTAFTAAILSST